MRSYSYPETIFRMRSFARRASNLMHTCRVPTKHCRTRAACADVLSSEEPISKLTAAMIISDSVPVRWMFINFQAHNDIVPRSARYLPILGVQCLASGGGSSRDVSNAEIMMYGRPYIPDMVYIKHMLEALRAPEPLHRLLPEAKTISLRPDIAINQALWKRVWD